MIATHDEALRDFEAAEPARVDAEKGRATSRRRPFFGHLVETLPEGVTRAILTRELLVVLLVVWLPAFLASIWRRAHPAPLELIDELFGLVWYLGAFGLLSFLVWRNRESWQVLGLRKTRWWVEALWASLILLCCVIAQDTAHALMEAIGLHPHGIWEYSEDFRNNWRWTIPLFALVGAAFEEVLFRGYLASRLEQLTGRSWLAILICSVLFAIGHDYNAGSLVKVFAFGLVLGLFQYLGRSLPRLILAHWIFNVLLIFDRY